MGRIKRFYQDAVVYHVIVRCNNKQMLLEDNEIKKLFLNTFGKYQDRLGFKLYGFVVMDNHAHLLIQINGSDNLSILMQRALLSFGKCYRHRNDYVGHLWQGRFIAKNIVSDVGFREVLNYIHLNPVKANIVKHEAKYQFSSIYKYSGFRNKEIERLIVVSKYGDTSDGSHELPKV